MCTSANDYFKAGFGCKVYKLSLDAGFTCPNRDGTLDTRGCIFCSTAGDGGRYILRKSAMKALHQLHC